MNWLDIINNPALTAAFGVAVGGIITFLTKRRETEASIQDVWTKSTGALIDQYTKALDSSRTEIAALSRAIADMRIDIANQTEEIDALNDHIDVLTRTLEKHGITPPTLRRTSGATS